MNSFVSFIITWLLLALFWIALSGVEELSHGIPLFWAIVSVTGVAALSHRHITYDGSISKWPGRLLRLPKYCVWLMWEITKANWDVLLRIISVRPVQPRMIRYRPSLEDTFSIVTLANSITLTPGTVTVDIEPNGDFIIHAVCPEAAEGVLSRLMEAEVQQLDGRKNG